MADERDETVEIGLPIQIKRGLVSEIVIPAFGPHMNLPAAEVVGVIEAEVARAAVFLEPQRRADARTGVTEGWDEAGWRAIVRAAARGLGYGEGDAYALVWDPAGERTEEPLAASGAGQENEGSAGG
jgi:hypothetical protein